MGIKDFADIAKHAEALDNAIIGIERFQFLDQLRVFGGNVICFRVISLKIIEFQGPVFRASEFVVVADDRLAVAGFVDDELPVALKAAAAECGGDGDAVDA